MHSHGEGVAQPWGGRGASAAGHASERGMAARQERDGREIGSRERLEVEGDWVSEVHLFGPPRSDIRTP
jgi:hypothetical protein